MLPPIQDLVYLHVTLLLCQSKTQIMQWWAESCLSCFPAPYSLRLYSCPSGEASVMLQLGKTRTRLLMDPHRFIPSALLLRYAAVWGLCTLAWPWAEEFPCGGTRGWAGCQGKLTEVLGLWNCVVFCLSRHWAHGKQKCLFLCYPSSCRVLKYLSSRTHSEKLTLWHSYTFFRSKWLLCPELQTH